MSADALDLARAAGTFIGVRFRLYGRDPASGLDCVGLLLAALEASGRKAPDFAGYSLRSRDFTPFFRYFVEANFQQVDGDIVAGDVVQVIPGPGQLHILIVSRQGGFIHAHAGLGRVVQTPPPLPWQVERIWRLQHD